MSDYTSRVSSVNTKGLPEPYTQAEAMASLRQAYGRPPREPWTPGTAAESRPEAADHRRPAIVCNRQLPEMAGDAIDALIRANDPPILFVSSRALARVLTDAQGQPFISSLDTDGVRHHMARSAIYQRLGKNAQLIDIAPPIEVVRDVMAHGSWPCFPALDGIVEVPVLRASGTVLVRPGYDPETNLYYTGQSQILALAESPGRADIQHALAVIDDAIGEFPFVDPSSKANAIALLLTPVVRPAFTGNAPLGLIDAPKQGTGKGLFADAVALVSTGRPASIMTAPTDEEEWRKRLTATLVRGQTVIIIDNLEGTLDSPNLASVLTSQIWQDRMLGQTQMLAIPQRATWMATGNNIRLAGDMARRCYHIRMDSQVERPWTRTAWKHPDLRAWILANRSQLIAALLTLARAYFAADKPAYSGSVLGSFEPWSHTVGGILQHAGVTGFLANSTRLYDEVDEDGPQWRAFCNAIYNVFRDTAFTVASLAERLTGSSQLRNALPDSLADAPESGGFRQRLGIELKRHKDAIYGAWRIEWAGRDDHENVSTWKVVMLPDLTTDEGPPF